MTAHSGIQRSRSFSHSYVFWCICRFCRGIYPPSPVFFFFFFFFFVFTLCLITILISVDIVLSVTMPRASFVLDEHALSWATLLSSFFPIFPIFPLFPLIPLIHYISLLGFLYSHMTWRPGEQVNVAGYGRDGGEYDIFCRIRR
jgi:hypothetical protein